MKLLNFSTRNAIWLSVREDIHERYQMTSLEDNEHNFQHFFKIPIRFISTTLKFSRPKKFTDFAFF